MRAFRLAVFQIGAGVLLMGCAAAPVVVPALTNTGIAGFAVYQRWKARGAQDRQTDEIIKLREEVERLRQEARR